MKKKILTTLLAVVLAVSTLAGCGGSNAASDEKTITVGASSTPHAEILEVATSLLAEKGYTLEVTIFDDYVIPNEVVESG